MAQLCHCHDQEENTKHHLLLREKQMVTSQPKTTNNRVCNELEAAGGEVPVTTVKCVLHQHELSSGRTSEKAFLQMRHLKAQLKIAADHMDKEKTLWRKTLWSDGSKTE